MLAVAIKARLKYNIKGIVMCQFTPYAIDEWVLILDELFVN